MKTEGTIENQRILDSMRNLFEQGKKLGMMGTLFEAVLEGEDGPSVEVARIDGVAKGTLATIAAMFFRAFHHHPQRDEMLDYVGLDRDMYNDVAKAAAAAAAMGTPRTVDDLFETIVESTVQKH